jgi:hypothetical protein
MSARPGLCGGHRVTGVPTAINGNRAPTTLPTLLTHKSCVRLMETIRARSKGPAEDSLVTA